MPSYTDQEIQNKLAEFDNAIPTIISRIDAVEPKVARTTDGADITNYGTVEAIAKSEGDAAEIRANSYTDSDRLSLLNAAQTYAEEAAEAKADLAETISKAYADGIVTIAEEAAIQNAINKANAAKAEAIQHSDNALASLNLKDGVDGNKWYSVTGDSSNWSEGAVGDFALSDGTNVYKKTDIDPHTWIFVENLTGLPGRSINSVSRNSTTGQITINYDSGEPDYFTISDGDTPSPLTVSIEDLEGPDTRITFSDENSTSFIISDGDVARGISTINRATDGSGTVTVTYDDNENPDTFVVKDGRSISSVTKSGQTVTINYDDSTNDDFTVTDGTDGNNGTNGTNGNDGTDADQLTVTDVTKSGPNTTVTMSDNSQFTIDDGLAGLGIKNISKSGETVTVTFDNNSTSTFTVSDGTNGADGSRGAGVYNKLVNTETWSNNAAESVTPGDSVLLDEVTLYSVTGWSETRYFDGVNTWIEVTKVIDGNLIVNGDALIDQVFANALFAKNVEVSGRLRVSSTSNSRVVIIDANSNEVFRIANSLGNVLSFDSDDKLQIQAGLGDGTIDSLSVFTPGIREQILGTQTADSTGGYFTAPDKTGTNENFLESSVTMQKVNLDDIVLGAKFFYQGTGNNSAGSSDPVWKLIITTQTREVSGVGNYSNLQTWVSTNYTGNRVGPPQYPELYINYSETVSPSNVTDGGDILVTYRIEYVDGVQTAQDEMEFTSLDASQIVQGVDDAKTLDGQGSDYYLEYENFTGTPVLNKIKFGPSIAENDDAAIEWLGGSNNGFLRFSTSDDAGVEYMEFGDYDSVGQNGTFTRWSYFNRTGAYFSTNVTAPIFNGSLNGNASTASNASNANNASQLGGNSASAFYKTTDTVANAINAITSNQVYIPDTRGADRAPSYYPDNMVSFDFQNKADTNAGGDDWHVLQTVAKWSSYADTHKQQQVAYTGAEVKHRTATSDTAWGGWKTFFDSSNFGKTQIDNLSINAATVGGFSASQSAGSVNTCVVREYRGYIMNSWFNSNRGDENTRGAASYIFDSGDGFMRKKSTSSTRGELVVASDILSKIKTVDGAGSGLDADLFHGRSDSNFSRFRGSLGNNDVSHGSTAGWPNKPNGGSYFVDYVGSSGVVMMSHDVGGSTPSAALEFMYSGKIAFHSNTDSNRWNSFTVYTNVTLTKAVIDGLSVNANTLNGYSAAQGNSGNTVAVRDNSGDIKARLFRSEYASENSSANYLMCQNSTGTSDNYIRPLRTENFLNNNVRNQNHTWTGKSTYTQGIARSNHHVGHLEGSYNNVGGNGNATNPIYTIGSSYNPSTESLNNMYGIGYTYSNASFIDSTNLGADSSDSWGMYVTADGNARVFLDGSNGHGHFKGNVYSASVIARGTVTGIDCIATSDIRVKQNLQPILGAAQKLKTVRTTTHERTDHELVNGMYPRKASVIAQDIERVLPEGVTYADDKKLGRKLNVSVPATVVLTIAAVNEHTDTIAQQAITIANQAQTIEEFTVRLERLERLIGAK